MEKTLYCIRINGEEKKYPKGTPYREIAEEYQAQYEDDIILAEFCKDFAENIGIAVCGEFDSEDKFSFDYYYPYLRGTVISSEEDVSIERHAGTESYAGVLCIYEEL